MTQKDQDSRASEELRRILIVDDESFIRQSLTDFFEDCAWEPVSAASGEAALELLDRVQVECAIVDVRLGGMDGNTFIREALRRGHRISYVTCTGSLEYALPEDLASSVYVSKRVFRKPVTDLRELHLELSALVSESRRRAEGGEGEAPSGAAGRPPCGGERRR